MTTQAQRHFGYTSRLAALLLLSAYLGACSTQVADENGPTEQDLQVAARIMSASLTDGESGLISNLYDAFSTTDGRSLQYGKSAGDASDVLASASQGPNGGQGSGPHHGRGHEKNFVHSYDSTTGIHTLSFDRSVSVNGFSKSLSILNKIVYTDTAGAFIAAPKRERNRIESIAFTGEKSGSFTFPLTGQANEFSRIDTMNLDGIHASSATLTIDGSHYGTGQERGPRRQGGGPFAQQDTTERPYAVEFHYNDIVLDKALVAAGDSLETGITGTITYKLYFGSEEQSRVVEGTVDLEGDAKALLKIKGLRKWIRFSLRDGETEEQGS